MELPWATVISQQFLHDSKTLNQLFYVFWLLPPAFKKNAW